MGMGIEAKSPSLESPPSFIGIREPRLEPSKGSYAANMCLATRAKEVGSAWVWHLKGTGRGFGRAVCCDSPERYTVVSMRAAVALGGKTPIIFQGVPRSDPNELEKNDMIRGS